MREDTLRDERFEVRVSFDERRGYVAYANGLPTITALSRADASMSGSSARTSTWSSYSTAPPGLVEERTRPAWL
jgi:hypothetical protein